MITLPSDVEWVGDIGVFVVEGDPNPDPFVAMTHWQDAAAQFVAPEGWAQYDKRCETCGGTTRRPDDDDFKCPQLCEYQDGRQVWGVQWPCRQAMAKSAGEWWLCEHCHYSMIAPALGPAPRCPGSVTARATIEVVPVVYMGRFDTGERPCVMVENASTTAAWYVPPKDGKRPFALDPRPRPGRDFAVIVRRAAS